MKSILEASGYLGMFLTFSPAAKYALKSHYLGRQDIKNNLLGYNFMFISFSVNLVVLLNKNVACLAGIGYQDMLVKTLDAPPDD